MNMLLIQKNFFLKIFLKKILFVQKFPHILRTPFLIFKLLFMRPFSSHKWGLEGEKVAVNSPCRLEHGWKNTPWKSISRLLLIPLEAINGFLILYCFKALKNDLDSLV